MDRNDDFGDKARRGMDRAGDAISRGVDRVRDAFTDDDDQHYRNHHSSLGRTDSDYDQVRTGYQYGHTTGSDESYRGRAYDDIESDLRRDYTGGDYDSHRDYIRHGYERSSQRYTAGSDSIMGASGAGGITGGSAGATGGHLGSYSGERSNVGGTDDVTYTAGGTSSGGVTDRTGDQASDPRLAARDNDDEPSAGDLVGEAAGGISGVLTGAALGSMGGPVGTIIGGIAGAVGGWWTGRAVSEAASSYTDEDEDYYRSHYESNRTDDVDYDTARTGYQLGHIAGGNPDYQDRSFDEVESDLRRGWGDQDEDYTRVRDYARHGYERSSQRFRTGGSTGGTAAGTTGATQGTDRDVGVGDDSGIGGTGSYNTGATVNDQSPGGSSGGHGGVASTQQAGEFGKAGPMGTGNYGQNTGL